MVVNFSYHVLWKALNNEAQQLVGGTGNNTPLASDISTLEDSTFKVGKLSVEQRKEKIHRYMKKRNERNFSKKIKVPSLSISESATPCFCICPENHLCSYY